ncbi:hypothetical protein KC357_g73 [Hortaea werneckii]|nr:hypothetical protein KC357_g73 [Hortaea werneckii]
MSRVHTSTVVLERPDRNALTDPAAGRVRESQAQQAENASHARSGQRADLLIDCPTRAPLPAYRIETIVFAATTQAFLLPGRAPCSSPAKISPKAALAISPSVAAGPGSFGRRC